MDKEINYRQMYAIQSKNEKLILKLCPNMPRKAGIYLFYRVNEKGENCAYIGQAKDLLHRTAEHISVQVKKTHIDKSLYVHKLYNPSNPNGWKVKVLCLCPLDELDIREQKYIEHYYCRSDVKLYNVTGGGQLDKKEDVGERLQVKLKSYKNGKNLGYEKAREQIKTYFEKYLDYSIKGKPNKIKERKLQEFTDFLADKNEEESKGE